MVKVGVWENDVFIGVVIFGRGANHALAGRYDLEQTECCELVRIALRKHQSHVSRIGAIAVRMLRKQSPGIKLVVSYADPEEGHHGGIYQAMGWLYLGSSNAQADMVVNGVRMHKRTVSARYGTASLKKLESAGIHGVGRTDPRWKHTFVLPLDPALKERLKSATLPYPKRAKQAMAGPPVQRQGGTDPRAPI